MFSFLAKIFGTKADRDVKSLQPYADATLEIFESLKEISDQELRDKTFEFKSTIKEYLIEIDTEASDLQSKIDDENITDLLEKETYFNALDELEKERNKKLEEVLLDILPEAYAVVKETARRYAENGKLVVKTTEHDIALATKKRNVQVNGETTTWLNKWDVAGPELSWNMVHYDVQLLGGTVLHQGKISEMATGEGKTLVSTLPAYLNALAGKGVHIVTVNEYLAKRDSEWNAPLFEFHGMIVDCIDKHEPHSEERKKAYLADITYGTNNEFGFDYLRDNMVSSPDEMVQR